MVTGNSSSSGGLVGAARRQGIATIRSGLAPALTWFNSGIVRALENAVILNVDSHGALSLTAALATIAGNAEGHGPDRIIVHCQFCL